MIEVAEWGRSDRSDFSRWPDEPNVNLNAFLLRSQDEPWYVNPSSLSVRYNSQLIGRFSYRLLANHSAFVGIVVNPHFRGRGFSVPAFRASLLWLVRAGVSSAFASVAVANTPSVNMLSAAGFTINSLEWRDLDGSPDLFDVAHWPSSSYTLRPLSMLYARVSVVLSLDMYSATRSVGSHILG